MRKRKETVLIVNAGNENHYKLAHITMRVVAELKGLGYKVEINNLFQNPANYCTGCKRCFANSSKPCESDPNFNAFAAMLLRADIVLFAVPVFWDTPPAILQAVLDKFSSFLSTKAIFDNKVSIDHKRWGFIGVSDEPHEIINNVKDNLSYLFESFEWNDIGNICCIEHAPDFEADMEREIKAFLTGISEGVANITK